MPPSEVEGERNSDGYQRPLSALKAAADATGPMPGSKLDDAKRYFDNHWETGMRTFLSDGRIDLNNNLAWRAVKPFAICRRNFFFSRAERGARASCVLTTILDIASGNYIASRGYIEFLLGNREKLPFEDLLPWPDKIPESIRIPKKNKAV